MTLSKFNRTAMVLVAGAGIFVSTGCATKNHVKSQTTPIINRVNELDDLTAENSRNIREVDSRAQQGIKGAQSKALEADQKAQAAGQTADQAQTTASTANQRADVLHAQVANLDNYRPVVEAAVHFGFDKFNLTTKAKEVLDQLAAEVPNTRGYLIEIVGSTDPVGDPHYNYQLSERRAASVVQYLVQQHNVPAHKVRIIGIGKDRQLDGSYAKNRRVEIRLLTNTVDNAGQQTGQLRDQ